jgi:hypothetical protein
MESGSVLFVLDDSALFVQVDGTEKMNVVEGLAGTAQTKVCAAVEVGEDLELERG